MNSYEKDGFIGSVVEHTKGAPMLLLVGYKGEGSKIEVPSCIEGEPVMELRGTFSGNDTVEEVTLPEGMTTIGVEAFRGCTSLKKVTFSSTIKEVGLQAFTGCTQLEAVDIPQPDQLRHFSHVFDEGRYPWTEDGFLIFGSVLFAYSGTHKVVRVPEGVKTIRSRVFKYSSAEEVILPSTVEVLEWNSFDECYSLTKVTFTTPSSLRIIKKYAFDCEKLEKIDLPSSLERIEEGAFWKCSHLAHVTLSPHTEVEKDAFILPSRETAYLSYLPPNVVASLTDLGQSRYYLYHFERMEERTPQERVELQEGTARFLREMDFCIPYAIDDKEQDTLFLHTIFTQRTVEEVIQFFDWGLSLSLAQFETYLEYSIKAGNTSITAYLLEQKKRCYTEKEIEDYETRKDMVELGQVLPTLEELSRKWNLSRGEDGVKVMGYRGGSGREVLPSCTADGVNISSMSPRNYLSSGQKNPYGDLQFLEMGEGIGLSDRTFMGAGLEEIRLPKDLKVIPTRCFYYTPFLREIQLPEGLTRIEERGLSETGLEEIVLPKSLETLGITALDGCLSLKRVVFRGSLEELLIPSTEPTEEDGYFASCPLLEFVGDEEGENQREDLRELGFVSKT